MGPSPLWVSIDVVSEQATLAELSSALAIAPTSSMSHEKGARRTSKDVWRHTIWRLNSRVPEVATISEHVESLLAEFPVKRLAEGRLPGGTKVLLNVGVPAPYFCRTLDIPSRFLHILGKYGIDLSVAMYAPSPSADDSGPVVDDEAKP